MKLSLKILLLSVLVFLGAANLYAQQVVVLDPVTDYEFSAADGVFSIPIGATFMKGVTSPSQYELVVTGAPSFLKVTIQKPTPFRIRGTLITQAQPVPGTYYISVTARDNLYGATSSATMKLRIVNGVPNRPIILDPIEQIKVLKIRQWYSLALSANDEDPEPLILTVSGADDNGLGYAAYKQEQQSMPGRVGGVLLMYMERPGELKINVVAKDERSFHSPGDSSNKTATELRFLVVN